MKKVLITMSALAIALFTTTISQAACGAGGCSLAPSYSSYNSNYSSNYAYRNNGSCCGCAAPIYTSYEILPAKCCYQQSSCCGCAAPMNNCNCGCNNCCPQKRSYFNFFKRNNNCGCGCNY